MERESSMMGKLEMYSKAQKFVVTKSEEKEEYIIEHLEENVYARIEDGEIRYCTECFWEGPEIEINIKALDELREFIENLFER